MFYFNIPLFACFKLVYNQTEQDAIVTTRNEAAAKEIAKIKKNTLDALAKLVNLSFIWVFKDWV